MVSRREGIVLLAFGLVTVLWAALLGNMPWTLGGAAVIFVGSVAVMHAVRLAQARSATERDVLGRRD